MRWAFWRGRSTTPPTPPRPLPGDVGLPPPRSRAAARPDPDDRDSPPEPTPTSRPTPTDAPAPVYDAPLVAPDPGGVDRTALATCGPDLSRVVSGLRTGTTAERHDASSRTRTLAVAATGALAARLPALSGADGALDESQDELLHAYADLLVSRTERRAPTVDREDLLAVAHVAAAAAAVDAAAEPALLLLAGVPADAQLRAAALLLAQTAEDGGGAADHLPREVTALFGTPG